MNMTQCRDKIIEKLSEYLRIIIYYETFGSKLDKQDEIK